MVLRRAIADGKWRRKHRRTRALLRHCPSVGPGSSRRAVSFGSANSLDSPVLLCEGAGVVAERQDQRAWVSAGLQARGFPRPDGKWLIKLPEDHPELWGQLIEQVRSDLTAPLLINTPADLDAARSGMLQALVVRL